MCCTGTVLCFRLCHVRGKQINGRLEVKRSVLARTPVKREPEGPVRSLVVCTPCVTDPTMPLASPLTRPTPLQTFQTFQPLQPQPSSSTTTPDSQCSFSYANTYLNETRRLRWSWFNTPKLIWYRQRHGLLMLVSSISTGAIFFCVHFFIITINQRCKMQTFTIIIKHSYTSRYIL